MPQLFIEDFKAGLDTRRSAFTAPAGTLRELVNMHVTRGGELEKRKAFANFATLPAGATVGMATARDEVYVFGAGTRPAGLPAQIQYLQLAPPSGSPNLVEILDTEVFNGLIYAIARFDDGNIYHYYDGARIADWDDISEELGDNSGVAAFLATRVNALAGVTASASGTVITVTGPVDGGAFTFSATAVNGGSTDDQTLTGNTIQAGNSGTAPELTIAVTAGSNNDDVGIEIPLSGGGTVTYQVAYDTDNGTTAALLVTEINNGTDGFAAVLQNTNEIVLSSENEPFETYNGTVITRITSGTAAISAVSTPALEFAGGVNRQQQVTEFTVGGTFEPQDQFTITIDAGSGDETVTTRGAAVGVGTTIKALGAKLYSTAQSVVYSSGFRTSADDPTAPAVPDPTLWGVDNLNSDLIVVRNQYGGSDVLTGLGIYQDQLAIFGDRAIQIYQVSEDPDDSALTQVLLNVGSIAGTSIVEYGDQDIFFLAESGVRSLRARDSSNRATASDPGVSIDSEIRDFLTTLTSQQISQARAVVDPSEGRYLLALGDRVYVYSTFPGSDISAWSRYDFAGSIDEWATSSRQLFARSGDEILLYGGATGLEYDNSKAIVDTPFLDGSSPATVKHLNTINAGVIGTWDVYLYTEPSAPDHREYLGKFQGSTYGSVGSPRIVGNSTHFRLRMETTDAEAALVGNLVIDYNQSNK